MQSEKQLANLQKGKATQFKQGEKKAKEEIEKRELTKARRRTMREEFEILLTKELTQKDENGKITKKTVQEIGSNAIIQKYMDGDLRAYELVRDTVGEKPAEVVMVSEIDADIMRQVEEMVNGQKASG